MTQQPPKPTQRKQKPRPAAQPYVLCIGKWVSMALTAEIYGFELNERSNGLTPIAEIVPGVVSEIARKAGK